MYGPIRKVAPVTAPRLSAVESIARPFTYHVLPLGGSWKVGAPGELQPSSVHSTIEDAIERAERLARRHLHGEVVVHRDDAPASRARH